MARPDFLIIGTQRGGTTSLFDVLSKHPEIISSKRKEVHFFDEFFHKGPIWYEAFFNDTDVDKKSRIGEATPMYLFHPHVPKRVSEYLPDIKLIVLLRDPVDRAHSHYFLERKRNNEPLPTFQEAVSMESERTESEKLKLIREPYHISQPFKHHTYLQRGLYGEQLLRWTEYFPINRFLILRSEDIFSNPKSQLAKIFDFLEISHILPNTYPVMNKQRDEEILPAYRKELYSYFAEDGKLLRSIAGERFSWT